MSWEEDEYEDYLPEAIKKPKLSSTFIPPKLGPFDMIQSKRMDNMHKLFDKMDVDGGGDIDFGELGDFLRASGAEVTDEDVLRILNVYGVNNSTLTFKDFCSIFGSEGDGNVKQLGNIFAKKALGFVVNPRASMKRAVHVNEIGLQKSMDESLIYIPDFTKDSALCGVFEGIGKDGGNIARWAGERLAKELKNRLKNSKKKNFSHAEALREAFLATHAAIGTEEIEVDAIKEDEKNGSNSSEKSKGVFFKLKKKKIEKRAKFDSGTSGVTSTIIWLFKDRVLCANVGGCTAVVGSLDNETTVSQVLTEKHSAIDHEKERSRVLKIGGSFREQGTLFGGGSFRLCEPGKSEPGLLVTRALGCFDATHIGLSPEPSVKELYLSEDTKICAIATTGLWDCVGPYQAMKLVLGMEGEAEDIANALLAMTYRRRTTKNITILCFPIVPM